MFSFTSQEEAEVLLGCEGLTQLKDEYNISGGAAARPALSSGRGAGGRVDQNELWARFPWLQVVWGGCTAVMGLVGVTLGAVIRGLQAARGAVVRRTQDRNAPHAHQP